MALSLFAKIRGERLTVGFDIGHYSIKYVKVYHYGHGNMTVLDADLERIPEGAIINGEIQRSESSDNPQDDKAKKDGLDYVSEAFAKLILRHPLDDSADYVACVNSGAGVGGVLVDRLNLKLPKNSNESAIILQTAQSRPPFDDQDTVIDYEIASREGPEVKVNVVAAKNDLLDNWARFYKSQGVKLSTMDVDIFGLVNAYMYSAIDADLNTTVAIVNIGEKKMSIAFIQKGAFHSMRAMTGGSLDMVISKLCSQLGIDSNKCHEIFEKGDFNIVDGFSASEVESVVKDSFADIMAQIEFGIRYFESSEDSESLGKIVLGGGGASIPGLKDYIAEKTNIETDTVNPFRYVEIDKALSKDNGISLALSNIYAPALGLAMRKF